MHSKMFQLSRRDSYLLVDDGERSQNPSTTRDAMTIDNKHNFADAEVLLDDEYFPMDDAEPVAQAVLVETVETTSEMKPPVTTTSRTTVVNSNTPTEHHFPDMTAHNEQHKRNIVRGVISGVLLGGILLGPIGAIAGGFIGSSIVNGREKRWHYRRRGFHPVGSHRMNHHFTSTRRGHYCGPSVGRCHGRWH